MSVAAAEIRDREQFVLIAEQRVAYEKVMSAVRKAKRGNHKQVIVVTGGPGSGKSVIALSVLGELYRRGVPALHATGSQSFTKTMRRVAGHKKREVQQLFKYFNSFMEAEPNDLDVLICDEAHRLRKTSANRYTKAALRTGRPQVAELIDAARVPVFLLDQHQVVRPGEMGTRQEIERAAAAEGLDCTVVELDGQFRCGGSDAYEKWVIDLLGLDGGTPSECQNSCSSAWARRGISPAHRNVIAALHLGGWLGPCRAQPRALCGWSASLVVRRCAACRAEVDAPAV